MNEMPVEPEIKQEKIKPTFECSSDNFDEIDKVKYGDKINLLADFEVVSRGEDGASIELDNIMQEIIKRKV